MIKVNVLSSHTGWKKALKDPTKYLKKKLKKLNKNNIFFQKKKIEFSILLAGNKEIKNLNKKFRNKNKSTDILSFPFYEKKLLLKLIKKNTPVYLGDIIINFDKKIYKKHGSIFNFEFDKLWIHGLLHLLGKRHSKKKEFLSMQLYERNFFKSVN